MLRLSTVMYMLWRVRKGANNHGYVVLRDEVRDGARTADESALPSEGQSAVAMSHCLPLLLRGNRVVIRTVQQLVSQEHTATTAGCEAPIRNWASRIGIARASVRSDVSVF